MSIVIQGIEMPKVCFDCPCHDGEWGRCNITKSSIGLYDSERPQDCPLKESEPVRHGHWVLHERAEEWGGLLIPNFECSNCHLYLRSDGAGNYCPNCGAKMDEEDKQ